MLAVVDSCCKATGNAQPSQERLLTPYLHPHRFRGTYTFTPGRPTDTITVDSFYDFTIAVPEPTSLTLLAVGLFGVLGYATIRPR